MKRQEIKELTERIEERQLRTEFEKVFFALRSEINLLTDDLTRARQPKAAPQDNRDMVETLRRAKIKEQKQEIARLVSALAELKEANDVIMRGKAEEVVTVIYGQMLMMYNLVYGLSEHAEQLEKPITEFMMQWFNDGIREEGKEQHPNVKAAVMVKAAESFLASVYHSDPNQIHKAELFANCILSGFGKTIRRAKS
jgi:hypothetical protein